jgi:hypothetical protein
MPTATSCEKGNGFDQAGAKDRDWHTPHDDRGIGWNHRLAGMAGDREEMKERFT